MRLPSFKRKKDDKDQKDVFISHDHKHKDDAMKVYSLLTMAGIDVWLDTHDIHRESDVIRSMTSGIDKATAVIVCITQQYIEKCNRTENDNCKLELDYAYVRKGQARLVPVVLDKSCLDTRMWNGKVGAYLASHLYVDFSDDSKIVANAPQLATRIRDCFGGAPPGGGGSTRTRNKIIPSQASTDFHHTASVAPPTPTPYPVHHRAAPQEQAA